ncbi:MAG: hypothetical protein L6R42_010819, partial [Xanthoria sp. 1 TBL-2021]
IQRLQVKLHEDATPDFDVITSDAVTAGDIACVVRRTAHMPRGKLVSDELENLIYQEDYLLRYINDHDTPIAMLANAIRKGLVGGKSAIAKFLSLGPNVDGQTALCKALGNLFFSTESAVLRFDMSDFREKHTITLTIASATNAPAADITPPAATPAATPAAPPTAPIAVAIAPPVVTTVCRHNNLLAIALHHLSNDTLRARLQARIVNKRALARPKDGHMLLSSSTYKVSISVQRCIGCGHKHQKDFTLNKMVDFLAAWPDTTLLSRAVVERLHTSHVSWQRDGKHCVTPGHYRIETAAQNGRRTSHHQGHTYFM